MGNLSGITGGVGGFFGALTGRTGARASREAGRIIQRATDQSGELLATQQEQQQAALQPFAAGGIEGRAQLNALAGVSGPEAQQAAFQNFQESPGVAFLREQGLRGINQRANSIGRAGGTRLEAISRFNQGLAVQGLNQNIQQRQQLLGGAQTAATNLAGLNQSGAQAQAANLVAGANAQAGGVLGAANARQQGIGNLLSIGGAVAGLLGPAPAPTPGGG